ncbi:MAG: sulfite exporter TauE/SafE family protein [Saprospirales bacterium]|nr:sulfite exporter TauE/SafE family protein [Saprospirales bacterium]MBK6902210.1 sulfite exporter TauE/SafE family protein [Saprospirales bacterium]
MELWQYVIAILGGFFAGFINTLAGNGSIITLTIFTEVLGLPGNAANASNRIGIFTQCIAGVAAFHKNDRLKLGRSWPYILITTLGSLGGIALAVVVSNEQFILVFRYLMVVMFFIIVIKPERWLRNTDLSSRPNWWIAVPAFLAIGFYGGFIQMGMGLFFLAAMVLGARFSLTDSNAAKLFVVAIYTGIAILVFAARGMIDWKMGAIVAIGQSLGGWFTAAYASKSPKANTVAYWVLVIVVIAGILSLFDLPEIIVEKLKS